MKFLLLILGVLFFLNSCATIPKPQEALPAKSIVATGVFKAKTKARNIDGFFRISPANSTIDIASPLGFALYGIYINGNNLYVKDYMSGAKFTNADLARLNIPKKDNILLYEASLIYFTQNFFTICNHNENPNIHILECQDVSSYKLPKDVEFANKEDLLNLKIDKLHIENAFNAKK